MEGIGRALAGAFHGHWRGIGGHWWALVDICGHWWAPAANFALEWPRGKTSVYLTRAKVLKPCAMLQPQLSHVACALQNSPKIV